MLIEWRSPLGTSRALDLSRAEVGEWGVVAVSELPPMSLVQLGARRCFWDFQIPMLRKLADYLGVELPCGCDLFGHLWCLVTSILQLGEEATLEIVGRRVGSKGQDAGGDSVLTQILEIEEAVQVLDKDEQMDVKREQERVKSAGLQKKDYTQKFQAKRREVQASKAAASEAAAGAGKSRGKGKSKAAAKPKAKSEPRPVLRLPEGDLQQVQLRPLCPQGGYIWRGNSQGSWQAHFAPYSRFAASWHLYGHRFAAILALRYLWTCFLEYHGKRCPEDCPVQGLFEVSADETAAGSVILQGGAAASSGV